MATVALLALAGAMPLVAPPASALTEYRYEYVPSTTSPLDFKDVAWAWDGSEAIIVGGVQAILRYDGSEARQVQGQGGTSPSQVLEGVTYTPHGLAYVSGGKLTDIRVTGDIWAVGPTSVDHVDSVESDILSAIASSPGGRVLAIGSLGAVYELIDGSIMEVARMGDVVLHDLVWSPDGDGAFIVGAAGTVGWFNATTDEVVDMPFTSTHFLESVSWRPGTDVAWAVGEGGLVVELNATTLEAERVRPYTPRTMDLFGVSWHPDGDKALLVGAEGTTQLWRMGVFTTQVVDVNKDLLEAEWAPVGDEALVVGEDGTVLRFAPRFPTPPPNSPPEAVISSPSDGTTVEEGTTLVFDGSESSDPDGDDLALTWSSNESGLIGQGELVNTTLPVGRHKVTLKVDDGAGHNSSASVDVTVITKIPPQERITLEIHRPVVGTVLEGVVEVSGTATAEVGEIARVEVSIDQGPWRAAVGAASWTYSLDTRELDDGLHTLRVQASTDGGVSREATQFIEVRNEPPPAPPVAPNVTIRMRDRGLVDEPISFEAGGVDGSVWRVVWSFGDGSHSQGTGVHHAYNRPGVYEVTLELWHEDSEEPVAAFKATIEIEESDDLGPSLNTLLPFAALFAVLIYMIGYYGGRRAMARRR